MQMADVGVGPSGESVVVFEDVAVLTPRCVRLIYF